MGFGVQRYVYNHQVLSANIAIYRYLVAWGPGGGDGFPLWISGFLRLFFFFLADKLYIILQVAEPTVTTLLKVETATVPPEASHRKKSGGRFLAQEDMNVSENSGTPKSSI